MRAGFDCVGRNFLRYPFFRVMVNIFSYRLPLKLNSKLFLGPVIYFFKGIGHTSKQQRSKKVRHGGTKRDRCHINEIICRPFVTEMTLSNILNDISDKTRQTESVFKNTCPFIDQVDEGSRDKDTIKEINVQTPNSFYKVPTRSY